MKIQLLLFITIIPLFFFSCSSSTKSSQTGISFDNTAMTQVANSNIELPVPLSWNLVNDNYDKLFDIWLIDGNNQSSIGIIPININIQNGVLDFDKTLKFCENMIISQKSQFHEIEILDSLSYSLTHKARKIKLEIDGKIQSLILFGSEKKIYQSVAYFKEGYEPSISEFNNLVDIQESIIIGSKIK